jgi:predicted nucleic acid-binding protein
VSARLLWDASALAKRYYRETGAATVDALFSVVPASQMVTTFWGFVETYASLWRKRNNRAISQSLFQSTATLLRDEVQRNPDWSLLTIDDATVLSGLPLVRQHNLNATDAVILSTYLRYVRSLPSGALTSVLVAADSRLVRAANVEGLATLNPEAVAAADIPSFLASL